MWRKYSHSYIIYVCMYACICMCVCMYVHDFPSDGVVRNPPANAGDAEDMGLIPGLERSPGVENGNPLQYSCMNRGTWWATVHGVTKDWAHTHTHTHIYMYVCMYGGIAHRNLNATCAQIYFWSGTSQKKANHLFQGFITSQNVSRKRHCFFQNLLRLK